MDTVILNGSNLTLETLFQIAAGGRKVEIAPEAYQRLARGREIMSRLSQGGKAIYGFNRGVGWNKDQEIDEDFFAVQNRMIIRSHCQGTRDYNSDIEVRAMMAIRLNQMLIGASCASDGLVNIYRDFLNHGLTPRIPRKGSVGEADITTISHMGLAFTGEGEVSYKGQVVPTAQAMEAEGLKPHVLELKDAHTIILSNCQGEAMTAVMVHEVENLLQQSDLIFCLDYEGLNGNIEAMREDVNALRGLPGQMECAARCRRFLEGSYLYEEHPDRALQDPLSFRGGFTVTGTVADALNFVKKILSIQLNSPSDNPCIMLDKENLFVDSNFETTTLAVGVEMLSIALGHLSRTVNYRMIKMGTPDFTGLPRFLAPRDGSAHGFSTIQNTYSALDAENRSLINPSSVDFYHMQGGIEDHASNLPLVASKGLQIVDNLKYLVAMEALNAAQAVDLRKDTGIHLGKYTQVAYDTIRAHVSTLSKGQNMFENVRTAYDLICSGELLEKVSALG